MRISCTERSSVILSQKKEDYKVRNCCLKTRWSQETIKITISIIFNHFLSRKIFDALKRYKSTEVDRRNWLHVPSGTLLSTSSGTHQVVEI